MIAIVSLMSLWLVSAGKETYNDYQIRAAIDQAQQNLRFLELIRRGGNVVGVSGDSLTGLRDDINNSGDTFLDSFTKLMRPVVIDDEIEDESLRYSIQGKSSVVSATFPEELVETIVVPASRKRNDGTSGETIMDFYFRDSDPLIHSYTADAYFMKQRLGR